MSTEELAYKGLAEWREKEDKLQLDWITKTELEMVSMPKKIVFKDETINIFHINATNHNCIIKLINRSPRSFRKNPINKLEFTNPISFIQIISLPLHNYNHHNNCPRHRINKIRGTHRPIDNTFRSRVLEIFIK